MRIDPPAHPPPSFPTPPSSLLSPPHCRYRALPGLHRRSRGRFPPSSSVDGAVHSGLDLHRLCRCPSPPTSDGGGAGRSGPDLPRRQWGPSPPSSSGGSVGRSGPGLCRRRRQRGSMSILKQRRLGTQRARPEDGFLRRGIRFLASIPRSGISHQGRICLYGRSSSWSATQLPQLSFLAQPRARNSSTRRLNH